jgi:hypothetical protein
MLESPINNLLVPANTDNSDNISSNSTTNLGEVEFVLREDSNDNLTAKVQKTPRGGFDFVFQGLSDSSGWSEYNTNAKTIIDPNPKKPEEIVVESIKNPFENIDLEGIQFEERAPEPAKSTTIEPIQFLTHEPELVPGLYSKLQRDYNENQKEIKDGATGDFERIITRPLIKLWEDFVFEIQDYFRWVGTMLSKSRVVTLLLILLFSIPFIYYPPKPKQTTKVELPSQVEELQSNNIFQPFFSFGKDLGDNLNSGAQYVGNRLPRLDDTTLETQQPNKINLNETSQGAIVDNLGDVLNNNLINKTDASILSNKRPATSLSNTNNLGIIEGDIQFSDSQSEIFISSSLPANTLVIIDYNGSRSNAVVSPPSTPLPSGIIGIANRSTREKLSQGSNQLQTINSISTIRVKIIPE